MSSNLKIQVIYDIFKAFVAIVFYSIIKILIVNRVTNIFIKVETIDTA